jgi:uncharacterized membrane protein
MGLKGFLTTLGMGAGLMYLYDPEQGNRRRHMLRDRWVGTKNEAQTLWEQGTRDLQNRARGMQAETESMIREAPESIGIQGQWSPGARLLATLAGGGLTFYGVVRRGLRGTAATLIGLNLVSSGLMQRSLPGLMRSNGGAKAIDFHKTVTVNAPLEEVFEFWRHYPNFSRFMSHVREVTDMGNGRSHWVAEGPAGQPVEWDAVITEMEPNRVLAWESLPGSQVYNSGRVRFERADDGTRLNIHMAYSPPGGMMGHAIATLFGTDPKSALDEDMLRFKSLLEEGKTTTGGREVGRGEAYAGMGGYEDETSRRTTTGGGIGEGPQSSFSPPGGQTWESGRPGGGQGRVDEVGETGVYPASGPLPEGDADIQGMASWGQGIRGAEGYEDHGESELNLGPEGEFRNMPPGFEDEGGPEERK